MNLCRSSTGSRKWLVEHKIISENYIFNFDRHDIDDIRSLSEYVERVFDQGNNAADKDIIFSKIIRHIVLNSGTLYRAIKQCYEINTNQKSYQQVVDIINGEKNISEPGDIKCNIKNYKTKKPRKEGKKLYAAEARFFADNNIKIEIYYNDNNDAQSNRIVDIYNSASHDYICGFCHLRGDIRIFSIPKIISWKIVGQFNPDPVLLNMSLNKIMDL